jgi:predicted O-methyltransferase YrrM
MHLTWQLREVGDGPPILTSVDPSEAEELGRLAKGRRVLEVGSAHGYSACVMALAGAEHVTAIDNHSGQTWLGDTYATMCGNLDANGVTDKVEIIRGDSAQVMPQMVEDERKFGLIFIDGDHERAAAERDISLALLLIEPGGVICVHDFLEHCCCPDVLHAVNQVIAGGPARVVATMAVVET